MNITLPTPYSQDAAYVNTIKKDIRGAQPRFIFMAVLLFFLLMAGAAQYTNGAVTPRSFNAATVITNPATNVSKSSAKLNGLVHDNGDATTVKFIYGTSPTLAGATTANATTGGTIAAGADKTSVALTINDLNASTTYYYAVSATNAGGTVQGDILSFITPPTLSYPGPNVFTTAITINPLSPTGTAVPVVSYAEPVTIDLPGVSGVHQVAVDTSGNIYISDYTNKAIYKKRASGGAIITLASGLTGPRGIAVDNKGDIFFVDGTVKKIPVGGGPMVTISNILSDPWSIAVDAKGTLLYVTDRNLETVSPTEGNVKMIPLDGGATETRWSITYTSPIAEDAGNNLYIASSYNGEVTEIPRTGFGASNTIVSGLQGITGISVDAAGNLFVAANTTVKVVRTNGAIETIASGLSGPQGVATDASNKVYVSDNNEIKRFTRTGGYYVSPALPAGLNLNGTTGVISGKTTVPSPATNYTVTAYNSGGSTKATVNIAVKSNTQLTAINCDHCTLTPAFAPSTTSYTSKVGIEVTSINLSVQIVDYNEEITINGDLIDFGETKSIPLNVGANTVNIVVTARDLTSRTYTLTVTRASNNNNLNGMIISSGALSPVFAADTTSYTATVSNVTASMRLTPTTGDSHATVTINGTAVASGTASPDIALAVGVNTITTVVTAQDATTKTYTIKVTRLSNNTNLAGLSISSGALSPAFSAGVTSYEASVSNATASITLTPTTGNVHATVKVNGITVASGAASPDIALAVGSNIITTVVTAQDLTTKTYTVTVTRPSNDATLSALTLSSGTLNPAFAGGTVSYTASVSNATTSITVTPTKSNVYATISVNGSAVNSGVASPAQSLAVGENLINIVVTAQNGEAKTYTVTVSRLPSALATLSNLAVSQGVISPAFTQYNINYTDTVNNSITSVAVTPTQSDAAATTRVNGTIVASGTASPGIPLTVGINTINVEVTATDGAITYMLRVLRKSNDATLSALTLSSGTISPEFAASTVNYTAPISNATTSVTLTPTTNNGYATVSVNGSMVSSGNASPAQALAFGANPIHVVVTAQNGAVKTYTVTVTRPSSSIATLSNLTISSGTLSPVFSTGTTSYADTVNNSSASVTITPTQTNTTAVTRVNGIITGSGEASASIPLTAGLNTINVVVTASDGTTTKTYTITVLRKSNDATLSGLALNNGTLSPAFASNITDYMASSITSTITLTPTASNAYATISINGSVISSGATSAALPLTIGTNAPIQIAVTAQNGAVKTYTVIVVRKSNDATLQGLYIFGLPLNPVFSKNITSYTDTVIYNWKKVPFLIEPNNGGEVVRLNGVVVTPNTTWAGNPIIAEPAANVGLNVYTIDVTAADGITQKTYTITVLRNSGDVTLSALTPGTGTLTPAFAPSTITYKEEVPNATTSITLTPVLNSINVTMTVNGNVVQSGQASPALPLHVGANPIEVTITAQDGAIKTYTVTVFRLRSAKAVLSNLTASAGTLSPAFVPATTSYADTVNNSTASLKLTPTRSDASAVIRVNGTVTNSGTASAAIPLVVGINTIKVEVTASDGIVIYTLKVLRKSNDATLSALAVGVGPLSPAFASGTTTYTSAGQYTNQVGVFATANNANATISINGIAATSGTWINLNTVGGANIIHVVVTAQNGAVKTYTITVTLQSNDATLSAITLSSGTLSPVFAGGVATYKATVSNATSSITLTPTPNNAHATILVNHNAVTAGTPSPALLLAVGENLITVGVTAENGDAHTYTVTVTRLASALATLSNLSVSHGTLSPAFATYSTSYTDTVDNSTTSITVTPTQTHASSVTSVNGTVTSSGTASAGIPLVTGLNTISVAVTATDGTNTYTINVLRKSADATLSALTVSSGTLSPVFAGSTNNYTVLVKNTTAFFWLTPVKNNAYATISINGSVVNSGTASPTQALSFGANVIQILVTAQNGAVRTYTITVNRQSNDATLSALTLSHGTLNPAFNSNYRSFTASVNNSVSSIKLTPTKNDPYATIWIGGSIVVSGTESLPQALQEGKNDVDITVVAQDSTKTFYTITVTRAPFILNSVYLPGRSTETPLVSSLGQKVEANNLLSPNGDGINDIWVVKNIAFYPNNTVTVYDKTGQVIFTRKGYANDWDGSYRGSVLGEGTYYYLVDLGNGSTVKGFITVVRGR